MLGHATRQPLRRIVDEDVDGLAEVAQRLGEKRDFRWIGHVEELHVRLAAGAVVDGFGDGGEVFAAAAGELQIRPLVRQYEGQRRAEAPPGARDDHPLAVERHGHPSLNRCQLPSPRGRRWR